MKSSLSLSVIIPVYNEIELVDRQVRRMDAFMVAHVADHELIIIESGSTDGSGEACDRLARDMPRVRLVHEGARNGYGAAVRLGFAHATKDLLISIPVDLPFPLDVLPEGLRLIETADCVLSYRQVDDRPLFRRIQSRVYNGLIKIALGLPMQRVNSAFKLYRRDIIESMPLQSNGWFLDAEILYWIGVKKLRFREIPVLLPEREAGVSKVRLSDPFRVLRELFAFKRRLGRLQERASRGVALGSGDEV
jgi:glycosyltransferase involved in cell wall biosynthesis